MHIDVIVGNPPYQRMDGAGVQGGQAIYHMFCENADRMTDQWIFIIPTRWMTDTPRGVSVDWMKKMRSRTDYLNIIEYVDGKSVFVNTSQQGGVGIIHINKDKSTGKANISIVKKDNSVEKRFGSLSTNGVIIRNKDTFDIVEKIRETDGFVYRSVGDIIGTTRTFSKAYRDGSDVYLKTNWEGFVFKKDSDHYIRYFTKQALTGGKEVYISENDLAPGTLAEAKKFKLFINSAFGNKLPLPFIGGTDSACSQAFLPIIGEEVDNLEKANNFIKYFETSFLKKLVSELRTTQHINKSLFQLVPMQNFGNNSDIDWNTSVEDIDKQLYDKYNITV